MTTFVGALRHDCISTPFVIDSTMNGSIFLAYVEQILARTFRPGDIAIMDNLSAHKVAEMRKLVETREASVRYLPPCFPDLNSIELAFVKIKSLPRKAEVRTIKTLRAVIEKLMDIFPLDECANFFVHDGYRRSIWKCSTLLMPHFPSY